jgi:SAM-dependent methyltransferase
MGDPESATFYDQHPFDWVPIKAPDRIEAVVSRPLVELIQSLDVNHLHLPFADGTADLVISDGVILHTEDPPSTFTENFRILKPGRRTYLAVCEPNGR